MISQAAKEKVTKYNKILETTQKTIEKITKA